MIVNLSASAVRSRAKKSGMLDAINIRTGRAAARAELDYVEDWQCSVRIWRQKPGVEQFLASLASGSKKA